MSYRNEGEQERADVERPRAGMMRLFGEMMLLPFTVFVLGIELFARTIRELQRTTDQGMNLLAGETAPLSEDVPTSQSQSADSALSGNSAPPPSVTGGWGDLNSQTTTSTNDGTVGTAEVTDKETTMRDKDLSDDQLKLVRYKILFIKRDYETAFPEQEELVPDNMTGDAFAAWKVAEFIQRLSQRTTVLPSDWISGDKPKYPEEPRHTQNMGSGRWVLLGLPEKDKKYLRVFFEVLERYVREEDEDTDVDMLREIRNQLKDGIKVYSGGPSPSPPPPGGGGGTYAGAGGSAGGGPGYGGGQGGGGQQGGGQQGGGYAGGGQGGGGQQGGGYAGTGGQGGGQQGGGYAGGGGGAGGGPGYNS